MVPTHAGVPPCVLPRLARLLLPRPLSLAGAGWVQGCPSALAARQHTPNTSEAAALWIDRLLLPDGQGQGLP